MLRKRGRGVARKSQHTLGRALDFYIPGVKLRKLRNIGLRMQNGGVGYYPRSGSPFVHFDVGRVRHWPRMNRKQLVSVFPNGKTLHVPSDGKPLPGYRQAVAAYERRKKTGATVQLARNVPTPTVPTPAARNNDRGFLTALFTGGADEAEESAPQPQAAAPKPEPQPVIVEPEIVVASLPEEDIPLPREAPRAVVVALAEPEPQPEPVPQAEPQLQPEPEPEPISVEPIVIEPAAPEPETIPFQVVAANSEPQDIFADVPIPQLRPSSPAQDAGIAVAEARISGLSGTDLPPAIMTLAALDRPDALMRAQAVLNELRLRDASVDNTVGSIPILRPTSLLTEPASTEIQGQDVQALIPTDKPERRQPKVEQSETVVAALPQARPKQSTLLERTVLVLPSDRPVIESKRPRIKFEAEAPASQRFALLSRTPGTSAELAIATGVKTAPKAAKPNWLDQKPEPKPVVIPVEFGTALTGWALRGYSAARGNDGSLMAFVPAANRRAPTSVYTAGFQRERFGGDTNRFFGSAVKFLSVAKFSRTN